MIHEILLGAAIVLVGCDGSSATGSDAGGTFDPDAREVSDAQDGNAEPTTGHFYYTFDNEVFRIAAEDGAEAENLSEALNAISEGVSDRRVTSSHNGEHLVLFTDRFGCAAECLAIVNADLSSGELVQPDGADLWSEGIAAVTSDGNQVVYAWADGPHDMDLYLTSRTGNGWSAPTLLTADSTYSYNNMPSLSPDESEVAFDCGNQPYPESGDNHACVVGIDGTGFRHVVGADALPNARNTYVQNAHLGIDGWLFESSWPIGDDAPETIWSMPEAGGTPQAIAQDFPNAVSPCPLPDGRFGMLWLGREGNAEGKHELTVVARDGSSAIVLTPDLDVTDIGIGCSQ